MGFYSYYAKQLYSEEVTVRKEIRGLTFYGVQLSSGFFGMISDIYGICKNDDLTNLQKTEQITKFISTHDYTELSGDGVSIGLDGLVYESN